MVAGPKMHGSQLPIIASPHDIRYSPLLTGPLPTIIDGRVSNVSTMHPRSINSNDFDASMRRDRSSYLYHMASENTALTPVRRDNSNDFLPDLPQAGTLLNVATQMNSDRNSPGLT